MKKEIIFCDCCNKQVNEDNTDWISIEKSNNIVYTSVVFIEINKNNIAKNTYIDLPLHFCDSECLCTYFINKLKGE